MGPRKRCPACRRWLLLAKASCAIAAGDLLRGPKPPDTLPHKMLTEPEYLISFDGGARHRSPNAALPSEGPRAVGAGAAIWGTPNERGLRPCIAQLVASVPSHSSSMAAEAIGLRAGIALAAYTLGRIANIGVVGDNLPVMRLAAGNGRVRSPGIWEILEEPLIHTALNMWQCHWYAVRRSYNGAADTLATLGTLQAVDRAAAALWRPTVSLWEAQPSSHNTRELLWHKT